MEKKRYIEYDLMRIIACFGVILIHVAVFDQESLYEVMSFERQAIKLWGVLFRWAVPAFVMLSGMMILPKADESKISKLLMHRVIRMMVVYIVWSAIYSAYNVFVLDKVYATTKLKTFIDGCFSGEMHMWYIPMTAALYLASPILALMINKLDEKWTIYWLAGMFLFSSIIPFLIKLDIKFISTVIASVSGYMDAQFFGGWTLYFVLGWYIRSHTFTKREKTLLYVLSVVSLLYTIERTILYAMRTGAAYGVQNYEYPNLYFMGIGIMVLFKEEISGISFGTRAQKCIVELSKLTFGIYLSHVLLLKVYYALGVHIGLMHPIASVPLVAAVVFFSGAALTWLIRKIPVFGTYIA